MDGDQAAERVSCEDPKRLCRVTFVDLRHEFGLDEIEKLVGAPAGGLFVRRHRPASWRQVAGAVRVRDADYDQWRHSIVVHQKVDGAADLVAMAIVGG